MEGRVKQGIVGLIFVLSVSAVSGAVTLSQMRGGDDRPGKKESKSDAAEPAKAGRTSDAVPVTDVRPGRGEGNGAEQSIGQALGFGADNGRQEMSAAAGRGNGDDRGNGNGGGNGNHPGHGNGQGHDHHGNGHGHGHDHHDHDPPPVSPAHPGHHHGHGHQHHGNGHGHGHDHHDHD